MRTLGLLCILVVGCDGGGGNNDRDAAPDSVPVDARSIDAPIDAPVDADPYRTIIEIGTTATDDLDLLFVVDDSPSMADKQESVSAALDDFVAKLSTITANGLPNLHVGVVTTDLGTKGTGSPTAGDPIGQVGMGGCSGNGRGGNMVTSIDVNGTFIADTYSGGVRLKNYNGTLADTLGRIIRGLGAGGCGFEQPLHAMRRALDNNPQNAGFLRPGAGLGVVFVTDEDDCTITTPAVLGPESAALGPLQSFRCTRFGVRCEAGGMTSDMMNQIGVKAECTDAASTWLDQVSPYHDFLVGLKGSATRIVVASLMGPTPPVEVELRTPPGGGAPYPALAHSCSYAGTPRPTNPTGLEVADPGVRLQAFLDRFAGRSLASSVCQAQTQPLEAVAQLMSLLTGATCLPTLLPDIDPATPGIQSSCFVEDVAPGGGATLVPACGPTPSGTCWRVDTDAVECPALPHKNFLVSRPSPPPAGTTTRLRCVVP